MKTSTIVVTTTAALVSFGSSSLAFQATTPRSIAHCQRSSSSSTTLYEYIPSGFTKQSWAAFKAKEEQAKKAKNLGKNQHHIHAHATKKSFDPHVQILLHFFHNIGRMGPKGFKSRSMQSFQEALERGEAEHLLPVFNAKQKVARGELKEEDIPYMQRGELSI